jgi:hypothetical protein
MKLQITLLAVGIAISAGAVGAEFNRAANVAAPQTSSNTTVVASQSSFQQPITSNSKVTLSGLRPAIKGGSGDD